MQLPNDPTAVVLDSHPLWADAVEAVLDRIGIRTTAKAREPEGALAAVDEHRPTLVVAELGHGGDRLGNLATIKRICERFTDTRVIVVSASADEYSIESAFNAGAAAYVTKTAHPDDLATAIRQAFDPSLYLADGKTGGRSTSRHRNGTTFNELTPREVEILRLVAQGHSNGELAAMLWITQQTIKFHLSNIYRKLGVANRTEAARWAQVHGLLDQAAVPEAWGPQRVAAADGRSA
jgi:DNA-binding NarL/FixJ family response regulator